ncbi:hypothetical protein EUTSA_v10015055mg [Eutrema salsugineum]|uniref:Uncharacterized protein n=1 Tax=Eutrema salsugineum TaxID=72664 RepID=V4NBU0_EUTSA|nr:hypothetical protein EUTSA_v10015055mg [Eutrema salsugineum]
MVASRSCHSLWLEQWEGPQQREQNRTVRITSAPPVKRAAGAAGKYLVGQQSSGHSTKGGHTEQVREIGPAPLYKKQGPLREVKPRTYGSRDSSPVNIGSNKTSNRGRSTDLFFY